ncbi:MAG TPA: PepSY-like domain-containing protein [Chitinophagaceae bacterium]|nr:PepSY-like domain-containing protein [Chitinophagaceae bacterium]
MKKFVFLSVILAMGFFIHAQVREIPQAVKDAFTHQYPAATDVDYKDQLVKVNVHFKLEGENYIAIYNNNGAWKGSEKEWSFDKLSDAVKDGFSKSKYAEWDTVEVAMLYLPGGTEQYRILVKKNDLQKKYLYFNTKGRLLRESITI